jgi:hypothetical protein
MSLPESSSTDAGSTPEPKPDLKPRGSVLAVVVTLTLLGAFVWAIRPSQPKFRPASLDPPAAACPPSKADFVPTNFTSVPGVPLSGLSDRARNRTLLRLNMEPCSCGCGQSLAACRVGNPSCAISARDAAAITQDEARHDRPESATAPSSKP